MNFDTELKEILNLSDELDKTHGRSWARFKGDVINRKIIELISRHIFNSEYKIVGPSVYIEKFPTEFDAMIVRKESEPQKGTNAYRISDIRLILEIKKHGFYYKKSEGRYEIEKYFKHFNATEKPFLYLTVKESKKFIDITKEVLGAKFFCLCVSYGKPIIGEYERFIGEIKK